MHWKDTVITKIKWSRPKLTETKDGKLDLTIHVPLTGFFEQQAKPSFAQGMLTMMRFYVVMNRKLIEPLDLAQLFEESGLPEIATKFREAAPNPTSEARKPE